MAATPHREPIMRVWMRPSLPSRQQTSCHRCPLWSWLNHGPGSSGWTHLRTAEGSRGKGRIRIQDILEFVASDQTEYHSGQVKRRTLAPMEKDGQIEVDEDTRNRRGTYPEGTLITFLWLHCPVEIFLLTASLISLKWDLTKHILLSSLDRYMQQIYWS